MSFATAVSNGVSEEVVFVLVLGCHMGYTAERKKGMEKKKEGGSLWTLYSITSACVCAPCQRA